MVVNLTRLPIAQQLAVKALLECGKSERHTAKLSGISRETVRAIKYCKSLDPQAVDRIKNGLAGKFYGIVDRSLDAIDNGKLDGSTAQQLMMVAAIGTDKARLIEGKATSRTEHLNASDQELNDEIARLEGELVKWEDGAIVKGETVPGVEGEPTTPERLQASPSVEAA